MKKRMVWQGLSWLTASLALALGANASVYPQVAAGGYHTVGLRADGSVVATGNNEFGQCNVGDWFLPPPVDSPEEKIEALVEDVLDFVEAGSIGIGEGRALVASLDAALRKLEQGHATAMANILGAFVNKIEAKVNAGILTPEQGLVLIEAAQDVLEE